MTKIDWSRIQREKDLYRESAAALPFTAKMHVLERLRERDSVFRQARERFSSERAAVATPSLQTSISTQSAGAAIRLFTLGANATLVAAVASESSAASQTNTVIFELAK